MLTAITRFADSLKHPKSRAGYAFFSLLLFNMIVDMKRSPSESFYFWLFGLAAVVFSAVWLIATLARLRKFGWSFWWISALALPWCWLVWAFWWGDGIAAISVLVLWFAMQSMLVIKNGHSIPDTKEVEG
jgi:hypothetical protein